VRDETYSDPSTKIERSSPVSEIPKERKKKEDRWAEILDVAATVFAEKGYDGTTLQDIADRTGILKGSIYYYIETKGDLLAHLLRETHEKGMSNVTPIAEGSGDPVDRLKRMIHAHARYVSTDRARTAVFVHERRRLTDAQRKEYLGDEHAYRRVFEQVIKEGQAEGLIDGDSDPKLLAIWLLGSLNSLYQWYRPRGEFSLAKIIDHFINVWSRGIVTTA
jgi:AcrR family transcriptional regulator